jgi:hypothetical protein
LVVVVGAWQCETNPDGLRDLVKADAVVANLTDALAHIVEVAQRDARASSPTASEALQMAMSAA